MSNVEKYLAELSDARWQNPFVGEHKTEMDDTPDLKKGIASWYQSLIGMIMWMVETGRLDIIAEVPMMES